MFLQEGSDKRFDIQMTAIPPQACETRLKSLKSSHRVFRGSSVKDIYQENMT